MRARAIVYAAATLATLLSAPLADAARDASVEGQARSVIVDRKPRFTLVALGDAGGLEEDNLTAFLVGPTGSRRFALVDAGTVRRGLFRAVERGTLSAPAKPLPINARVQAVLTEQVRAVLLSHVHLDHVSGLAINATDDVSKPIYGLPATIEGLKRSVFNWEAWPNFGSEGERPLGLYRYARLDPGVVTAVEGLPFSVRAFPLSHGGAPSTMFLIEHDGAYLAYFGDTGPDDVEGDGALARVWDALAPLARAGSLRGIVIEASYPNARADDALFGHLTPRWLLKELGSFARAVDGEAPDTAIRGLPVVVSHVKPDVEGGTPARSRIAQELEAGNHLGVRFIHLAQGAGMEL